VTSQSRINRTTVCENVRNAIYVQHSFLRLSILVRTVVSDRRISASLKPRRAFLRDGLAVTMTSCNVAAAGVDDVVVVVVMVASIKGNTCTSCRCVRRCKLVEEVLVFSSVDGGGDDDKTPVVLLLVFCLSSAKGLRISPMDMVVID